MTIITYLKHPLERVFIFRFVYFLFGILGHDRRCFASTGDFTNTKIRRALVFISSSHQLMQQVDHIFHLIQQKYSYSLQRDPTRATHVPYMTGIQYSIKNIENEISANRSAHLEDELGDILWDFCNMIYTLEKEGYIDSYHNVWERALDKYEERVGAMQSGVSREQTKGLQKQRLFQEQVLKNS